MKPKMRYSSVNAFHSQKDIKFLLLVEDHLVFPKNVCKNLLDFLLKCNTMLSDIRNHKYKIYQYVSLDN